MLYHYSSCLQLQILSSQLTPISKFAYGKGAIGTLPRLLLIGIKGVIYTTYYAGVDTTKQVHDGMGFALRCEPSPKHINQQKPSITENKSATAAIAKEIS